MKFLVTNINISYSYRIENNNAYFDITLNNITPDVNNILDTLPNEEEVNHITRIMADDYNIQDMNKATLDIINIYEKERTISRRNQIIEKLDNKDLGQDERASLESELSSIIIKLARFK